MPESRPEPEPEEDSFKTEALEAWEIQERAAAYRALPLQQVALVENGGKAVCLSCGHRHRLFVPVLDLRVGDWVRCRECYEIGMKTAEKMVEGLSG